METKALAEGIAALVDRFNNVNNANVRRVNIRQDGSCWYVTVETTKELYPCQVNRY